MPLNMTLLFQGLILFFMGLFCCCSLAPLLPCSTQPQLTRTRSTLHRLEGWLCWQSSWTTRKRT